jgi:hypothetical protein
MIIYYDQNTESWYHSSQKTLTFGGLHQTLPSKSSKKQGYDVAFNLLVKDQHIGPLVGIMTTLKKNNEIAGNKELFMNIQKELLKRNSISYVFAFQDVSSNSSTVKGYIYSPTDDHWIETRMPYPDIIYNRVPFRQSEKTTQYKNSLQLFSHYNIPFFNPRFIDKYELYEMFSKTSLKKYLPETLLIHSKQILEQFLNDHRAIYIKPRLLARGKNTFRIMLDKSQLLLENQKQVQSFKTFDEFWGDYAKLFNNRTFIAQRAVKPQIYMGKRFDFRILSHWSGRQKQYIVTGIGIRAAENNQLTTHLAYGGTIIPYEEVQTPKHEQFINNIVDKIGTILTNQMGFFGEFSIDAGIDSSGQYVIYEVNSKPMSFDERIIEQKRYVHLTDLFFQMTGFNPKE